MATPYDDVILDHIRNARNYRMPESVSREIRGSNVLCGDELALYLRMDGGCIVDISFQCSCCGLSMASASVMTEIVKGKGIGEAAVLLREFTGSLDGTLHSDCPPWAANSRHYWMPRKDFPPAPVAWPCRGLRS
jgi:SUF system NifU family Fe-S assembly protein